MTAHANAVEDLEKNGNEMIEYGHFASETIRERLDEIRRLWELLLRKLKDKGMPTVYYTSRLYKITSP